MLLVSCNDFFSKNKNANANQIISEEAVDYNSIDAYPLLPECKNSIDRTEQKACFYQKLTSRIQKSLTNNLVDVASNIHGDAMVIIKVDSKGKASVSSIILSDDIQETNQKLDIIIRASISQLPTLEPAIKQGIPITTEFLLPIIIN